MSTINHQSKLGGAVYPFLQGHAEWEIRAHASRDIADGLPVNRPTLRWVNGAQVIDLHTGQDSAAFLEQAGLTLSLDKGGFVLSKRLSRIMRPYFISGFFEAGQVQVRYLEQDARTAKVWDGAGVISRRLLLRLIDQLPAGISPRKRRQLVSELKHAQRVEFTMLTAKGQDKGHAIVAEELAADLLLPEDTKEQVRLTNGQAWIGLYPVHGHDRMKLDIQSLINLHPFFTPAQLLAWLDEEGAAFNQAVRSNQIAEIMGHIHADELDELDKWHVREYFASGGDARWFAGIIRTLFNQRLNQLALLGENRLRLPIHGARYYVMCAGVGQAAGRQTAVARGQIRIDPQAHTAWISDDDWYALAEGGQGIASILGGADQDDALWLHPFTDHDGERRVLAWRSPNQAGEYVILTPAPDSAGIIWPYAAAAPRWPVNDSRRLTARTDTVQVNYLNLIDPATAGGLGEGLAYSVDALTPTILRSVDNQGVLGTVCNLLMLSQAVFGRLPKQPPAPLEQVIDASVKSGENLSAVKAWCESASRQLVQTRTPIPALLLGRLGIFDEAELAQVPRTNDHWLDRLMSGIETHIAAFSLCREQLAAEAIPPACVFDHGWDEMGRGARLNALYGETLRRAGRQGEAPDSATFEAARAACEAYLEALDASERERVILGSLAALYLQDRVSDAVVWQRGSKSAPGQTQPGIAQLTLAALRRIGALNYVDAFEGEVISYPNASPELPMYRTVAINGVWFNYHCAAQRHYGQPVPDSMNAVQRPLRDQIKRLIAQVSDTRFRQMTLRLVTQDDRLCAYTEQGNLFGLISRSSAAALAGCDTLTIQRAKAHDGNLLAIVS